MIHRLKCRWCDFSVPALYRTKTGKAMNGWKLIEAHQEDIHPVETEEQMQLIDKWQAERSHHCDL